MHYKKPIFTGLATAAFVIGGSAQACASSYSSCNPQGATATATPTVGGDLSPLYVDLLHSISGVSKHKRLVERFGDLLGVRDTISGVCCKLIDCPESIVILDAKIQPGAQGTQCLLMQDFNLPFCYVSLSTLPPSSTSFPNPSPRTNSQPTTSSPAVPRAKLSRAITPLPTAQKQTC